MAGLLKLGSGGNDGGTATDCKELAEAFFAALRAD